MYGKAVGGIVRLSGLIVSGSEVTPNGWAKVHIKNAAKYC